MPAVVEPSCFAAWGFVKMQLVNAHYKIETQLDGAGMLKRIEAIGRTCYQSDWMITEDSYIPFAHKLLERTHLSVIEHESVTVRLICDRGVSHEIVRHRLASYAQESTRFCNYFKDRFGGEIKIIEPYFWTPGDGFYEEWLEAMKDAERHYMRLMEMKAKPEQARSVLPNSLKTEIVITMNLREWRWFFALRTAKAAHPQIREVACPMLLEFRNNIPVLFDDPLCDADELKKYKAAMQGVIDTIPDDEIQEDAIFNICRANGLELTSEQIAG